MDHQEWFERFVYKLQLEEDILVTNPDHTYEEWKSIKIVLIRMATDLLPVLEKKIIRLVYDQGLSERQAASKLNISRAKLQRRKKRAIKMLTGAVLAKLALPRLPG